MPTAGKQADDATTCMIRAGSVEEIEGNVISDPYPARAYTPKFASVSSNLMRCALITPGQFVIPPKALTAHEKREPLQRGGHFQTIPGTISFRHHFCSKHFALT